MDNELLWTATREENETDMSATFGSHLLHRILLPLTVVPLALTGCSGASQPSQSTSPPSTPAQSQPAETSSPQAAGRFCEGIGAQMEGLNFFPPALSSESGGTALLQEVADLQDVAPPTVQDRIAALMKTMEKGVEDPDAFNRGQFIEAKIEVEEWILSNC